MTKNPEKRAQPTSGSFASEREWAFDLWAIGLRDASHFPHVSPARLHAERRVADSRNMLSRLIPTEGKSKVDCADDWIQPLSDALATRRSRTHEPASGVITSKELDELLPEKWLAENPTYTWKIDKPKGMNG